jgi:hypothetical protein
VTLAVGDDKTCTITNSDVQPVLVVVKHVIKDNGGTAEAADFTMNVTGSGPTPGSFPGVDILGTVVAINAGAYDVTETGPSGYTASFSADCVGSIAIGEVKTCTVTNDDVKASPGIKTAQVWTLNDTATISGILPGGSPDATVTFRLFTDAGCQDEVYSKTVDVTNSAASTSSGYTTSVAGTYYWTAVYSGDSFNDARTSECGVETTEIVAVQEAP